MNLNENIAVQRKMKNLSQDELASKLNVSRQAISKWETGKTSPDIENLMQLSKIFGITVDKLIGNEFKEVEETFVENHTFQPKQYGIGFVILAFFFLVVGLVINSLFLILSYTLLVLGLVLTFVKKNRLLIIGWIFVIHLYGIFNIYWSAVPKITDVRYFYRNPFTLNGAISIVRTLLLLTLLYTSYKKFRRKKNQ